MLLLLLKLLETASLAFATTVGTVVKTKAAAAAAASAAAEAASVRILSFCAFNFVLI